MHKLKITQIGNSVGVVLPREMLAKLKVKKGDTISAVEIDDGFAIVAYDAEFERQMEAYEEFAGSYRNALRELAK